MTTLILSDWNAPPKTVSEAAKWLGVDEHKIYDAINAHELPAYKPNGNTRGSPFVVWSPPAMLGLLRNIVANFRILKCLFL